MTRKPPITKAAKPVKKQGATLRACDGHLFQTNRLRLNATGLTIDDLDLEAYVADAARRLQAAHPEVVFTSGRRDKRKQADAMAGNVVKNRTWIKETYAASPQRDALQRWVNDHPEATTKAAIATGLLSVMDGWTTVQLGAFSRHLTGEAFDVNPVTGGDDIKATIRKLPNIGYFTDKEGGLVIWHASFKRP
jgi:hypothetical protein